MPKETEKTLRGRARYLALGPYCWGRGDTVSEALRNMRTNWPGVAGKYSPDKIKVFHGVALEVNSVDGSVSGEQPTRVLEQQEWEKLLKTQKTKAALRELSWKTVRMCHEHRRMEKYLRGLLLSMSSWYSEANRASRILRVNNLVRRIKEGEFPVRKSDRSS